LAWPNILFCALYTRWADGLFLCCGGLLLQPGSQQPKAKPGDAWLAANQAAHSVLVQRAVATDRNKQLPSSYRTG